MELVWDGPLWAVSCTEENDMAELTGEFYTEDEGGTAELAARLAETLEPGSFVALRGDLGAGKTAFARGVAVRLGVAEHVLSPTFTLLRVYESGRLPFYHFDVYRIACADELNDAGFYEYAYGGGVCLCEWAELIEEELPEDRIDVRIERLDDSKRRITVERRDA
jgi:tRNA threonylcarbamoyladenosine biosynthesis protein TsaE